MKRPPLRVLEQDRKAELRLRRIEHFEQITRNVSQTCRFFGISRGEFCIWLQRYRKGGIASLRDGKPGPGYSRSTTLSRSRARSTSSMRFAGACRLGTSILNENQRGSGVRWPRNSIIRPR